MNRFLQFSSKDSKSEMNTNTWNIYRNTHTQHNTHKQTEPLLSDFYLTNLPYRSSTQRRHLPVCECGSIWPKFQIAKLKNKEKCKTLALSVSVNRNDGKKYNTNSIDGLPCARLCTDDWSATSNDTQFPSNIILFCMTNKQNKNIRVVYIYISIDGRQLNCIP